MAIVALLPVADKLPVFEKVLAVTVTDPAPDSDDCESRLKVDVADNVNGALKCWTAEVKLNAPELAAKLTLVPEMVPESLTASPPGLLIERVLDELSVPPVATLMLGVATNNLPALALSVPPLLMTRDVSGLVVALLMFR